MRVYCESNTKCHVVEIHQCWKLGLYDIIIEWKSIQYFACGSEIPLSRTSKLSTCVNHGFDETLTQKPFDYYYSEENNSVSHTDQFI